MRVHRREARDLGVADRLPPRPHARHEVLGVLVEPPLGPVRRRPRPSRHLVADRPPVLQLLLGVELPAPAVDHQGAVVADERHPVRPLEGPELDAGGVLPRHQEVVELVEGGHRVGGLPVVIGIGELAPARHHAARGLGLHAPEHDVDEVDAPVAHQPARVVPEPPEVEVEPVGVEGPPRRGAEPAVVVDALGRRAVGHVGHRGKKVQVGPRAHAADAPQGAAVHELHGLGPVRPAAHPLPALHDPAVVAGGGGHDLALIDRVGQRLLHVHVLAGGAGVDHLQAVPVVGRADDHGVDVVAVEQRAVVGVERRPAAAHRLQVAGPPVEHAPVHVAEGGALHPGLLQQRPHVRETHAVHADGSDHDAVARGDRLPARGRGGRRPQRGARARGAGGGGLEEAASRQAHGTLHRSATEVNVGVVWKGQA